MRQITVYKFSELKPELQKKIWEKEGWRPNPWQSENWNSWEEFAKLFYEVIRDWDSQYKRVEFKECEYFYEAKGKLLIKRIWRKFRDIPESPTEYCFDTYVFGYAKKILCKILKCNWDIEDFINSVFRNFCEEDEKDDELYNTFESFKEDAELNEWEFTETGIQI